MVPRVTQWKSGEVVVLRAIADRRIEGQLGRRCVARNDVNAIEPDVDAVVVHCLEHQTPEGMHIRHVESLAQVHHRVSAPHIAQVGGNE